MLDLGLHDGGAPLNQPLLLTHGLQFAVFLLELHLSQRVGTPLALGGAELYVAHARGKVE